MTLALESRLRALAAQELEQLGREPWAPSDPVAELQRLESQARAMFLMEERDLAEVQQLLASHFHAWLALIRSDAPAALWSGSDRPQAGEYLMVLCDLLLGGLLEAIVANDNAAVAEFRLRFLDREPPGIELSAATMILARHLCLLYGREFERAADELEDSWAEWIEWGLVHPRDDVWNGVRGIANKDAELVHASLHALSSRRFAALRHAVESGLMLRSTLPVRLTLQTDSSALLRLARMRGMEISLESEEILTRRAALLWRPS
ncbi:hypothetical protein [Cystobacter fuscus]|uniref:hypothetical protein n=1 Tax=Cystobacter fuscus TaxID=43 RepID=UPI002B2AB5A0|nr:hypothetical protein F0U63_46630 [Cystobacter fuscus]